MAKLRIAFSGIGAVGGYYGGMVAARYQGTIKADIFFIARGENLKAIRENGLQMQLGIRTIHTAPALATDNPAEIGPVSNMGVWNIRVLLYIRIAGCFWMSILP